MRVADCESRDAVAGREMRVAGPEMRLPVARWGLRNVGCRKENQVTCNLLIIQLVLRCINGSS